MFNDIKEAVFKFITSRAVIVSAVLICLASIMIYRLFSLQIINGEYYLDSFKLRIKKEKSIAATRGNIYDRNGKLLAYNELANSVTIEDVYKSGKGKNQSINNTLNRLIDIIENNGDSVDQDFKIVVNEDNAFEFTVEGNTLYRFLADVYGKTSISNLKYEEKTKTAAEVVDDLCKKYGVGDYEEENNSSSFVVRKGYTNDRALKVLNIRYNMNANSFQKYIDTTVASDVSEQTVADVMENLDTLEGVSIEESTARKYVDSYYFSQILGYTGKVSEDELYELQQKNNNYNMNDTVGKSGIEQAMESVLQGTKGSETVYVDNTGQVIETSNYVDSVAGNDVYLTIDKDLTEACYNIIEQSLAGILVSKIQNIKTYTYTEASSSSNIVIPIYDVYYAMFDNNVIDVEHFLKSDAGENEKAVYDAFLNKNATVIEEIKTELNEKKTSYDHLSKEYQWYMSHIASELYSNGILDSSKVDKEDATYIAWTTDETISLAEYLKYAIAMNWVDVSKLSIDNQYADSDEIFKQVVKYIVERLETDSDFRTRLYKYLLLDGQISGSQVCDILLEQDAIKVDEEEYNIWQRGGESSYTFMVNRIANLDITPAQLALDPCTGSMVITDVNTGDVLALVSYPGYDNNMMANGVDAAYYAKLRKDNSNPLYNYATQQKTAPGSTFKMVSSTAGLMEGIINTDSVIYCGGIFDKLDNPPRCWIYPRGHGGLNVAGGIRNSCNCFFYEVGYRLGIENDKYQSDVGLEKLAKYADMYGLTEKSGIEIAESEPQTSTMDSVRSAIGQGTNSFTTVGLARYVTTVANSGTCYNLTLIDRTTDSNGNLLEDYSATIRNTIDMPQSYWNSIHTGMRQVVQDKAYYSNLGVAVAGKTGTAQESKSKPNHSLFVCYAPYEKPEIAIATRIANGYTSSYAAQITKEALSYYFNLRDEDDIISGTAQTLQDGATNAD
ncbi:penicillin-binding transpeptidase domain-containing protein [Butyrivibrio sp. YAB3001]|uniref:penicillin-binding transpeptidase domain-containing protein n=1 Tax=Butyrivibrio sp. YAB3001 TaxID=1520812 RepID=UPI0008F657F3|nr:penicillin-binding transpeptidase domain-containing protein [Butyrivibrio sp. YAB3001]SFB67877.1 penicillin-binding protein 2 [Butyrivibrio sp. YAB3001]